MGEDGTATTNADKAEASKPNRVRLDVALIIALAPLVAAAIRIWLYSGGDSAIFLVLLRTINIPAVLIGTSVLLLPTLLVFVVFALLTDLRARTLTAALFKRNPAIPAVVLPIFFIITVYTTPWLTLAILGAICSIALVVFLFRRARRKRQALAGKRYRNSKVSPDSIATLFALLVTFAITQSNMWLPLERLEITGQPAEVGYVLESTSDWTTILTTERNLEVVPTSTVESRTVCASRTSGTLALAIQGGGLANGADCSD